MYSYNQCMISWSFKKHNMPCYDRCCSHDNLITWGLIYIYIYIYNKIIENQKLILILHYVYFGALDILIKQDYNGISILFFSFEFFFFFFFEYICNRTFDMHVHATPIIYRRQYETQNTPSLSLSLSLSLVSTVDRFREGCMSPYH
jgi:hypothetical protein